MIRFNNKVVPKGYELVWEKQGNTLYGNCLVQIESIALIKRSKEKGLFVRCAFRSFTDNLVIAVRVDIVLRDAEGNIVNSINDFKYEGFYAARETAFGQTTAIPVETEGKEKISCAEVLLKEVFFDDGQQLKCEGDGVALPAEKTLADYLGSKEMADYYLSKTQSRGDLTPVSGDGFWRCSCGTVNGSDEEKCFKCDAQKNLIFADLDKENLKAELDEYNRQKAEEERLRLEEEEKERKIKKKKQKKIAAIVAALIVVAILAYAFVTYLLPKMRYSSACDAMSAGDYSKAIELFEKLGEYEDSTTLILQSKYEYGIQQKEAGEYDSAVELFDGLGTYKDSKIQKKDAQYLKGGKLIEDGQFKEAVQLFSDLNQYKQSKTKKLEAMYGFVCANKDSKNSDTYEYIKILRKLDYKDIDKIYNQLYKWEVSIVVNNSEKDTKTSQNKISKRDKIHCHVTLSGGTPDGKTKLEYSAVYPNGSTSTGQWSKEWKAGTEGLTSFWYDIPEYGSTGTFVVKIYNAEDGKLLGQASVELTN